MGVTGYDSDDVVVKGGTDATPIGNTGDRMKVDVAFGAPGGTSTPFAAAVGTTAVDVPASAGSVIEHLAIRLASDQSNDNSNRRLSFSIDAGTTYFHLKNGEVFVEDIRGSITQIKVKVTGSGVTTANYEIFMNRAV